MDRGAPPTLLAKISLSKSQWLASGFGLRGLTMSQCLASVFGYNLNVYQVVCALISFASYCFAFFWSLEMPSTQGLVSEKHKVWHTVFFFIVGAVIWRMWMYIVRFCIRCEVYIEPYAHTRQGKVALLIMRAPGLTMFPVLGAYVAAKFTETKGLHVLSALGVCTIFVQLTCPHESDLGSVDMLEGIHLPILPQLKLPFGVVCLVSFLHYLRKFLFLGVQEGINWLKQPAGEAEQPDGEAEEQPEAEAEQQPDDLEAGAEQQPEAEAAEQPDDLEAGNADTLRNLQDLVKVTSEYVMMVQGTGFFEALDIARDRGAIDPETVVEYMGGVNQLARQVNDAREYLNGLVP